jgi:hypothetical protein
VRRPGILSRHSIASARSGMMLAACADLTLHRAAPYVLGAPRKRLRVLADELAGMPAPV